MNKTEIDRIVREVLKESGLLPDSGKSVQACPKKDPTGPSVLFVFHSGVRYLKKSLAQVRQIDETACRSSVFTAEPARALVCGTDVKAEAGIRCCLDKVKPEGVERALKKADILVLPTFCLKTASKIASLGSDTTESVIVLSALAQGKSVLATCDSFTLLDTLVNDGIRTEMDRVLAQLESFGMAFCDTNDLSTAFDSIINDHRSARSEKQEKALGHQQPVGLRLVTAKEVRIAVNNKQASISVAPGGIVTPLAKDQAKEYAVSIAYL